MISKRYLALLLIVGGIAGCKEEEDRPPPYSPVAVPGSLVPCAALLGAPVETDGLGRVRFDGGVADCFPEALVCTVGPCDGGLGVARCIAGSWRWGCEPSAISDAGQADAPTEDGSLAEGG